MCISAADSEMLEFGVPRRSNSYVPVKGYYIQARLKGHRTRGCSRGEYIHFFLTHHPQAGSFPMSWVYEDQAHRVWSSMYPNLESEASVSHVYCDSHRVVVREGSHGMQPGAYPGAGVDHWNQTMTLDRYGITHGDRAAVAYLFQELRWLSPRRTLFHVPGSNFLGQDVKGDSSTLVYDLYTCRVKRLDYYHGFHGCFLAGLDLERDTLWSINQIPLPVANCVVDVLRRGIRRAKVVLARRKQIKLTNIMRRAGVSFATHAKTRLAASLQDGLRMPTGGFGGGLLPSGKLPHTESDENKAGYIEEGFSEQAGDASAVAGMTDGIGTPDLAGGSFPEVQRYFDAVAAAPRHLQELLIFQKEVWSAIHKPHSPCSLAVSHAISVATQGQREKDSKPVPHRAQFHIEPH